MTTMRTVYDMYGSWNEEIYAGGEWRKLFRCDRRSEPGMGAFPVFRARLAGADRGDVQLIPESQWLEIDKSRFVVGIKDQDGIGECLCEAIAGIAECCRAVMGLKKVVLSGSNLYGQVTQVDQGSDFEETLSAASSTGIAPESVVPEGAWKRGQWPSGWEQHAAKYRVLEVYDCPTREHIASAAQLGFHCLLGVSVTDGFEPDSNGIIRPYQIGQLNHGVYEAGMKRINGEWYLDLVNSWGTKWGRNGRAWFPMSCLPARVNAWAVRGMCIPPDESLFG